MESIERRNIQRRKRSLTMAPPVVRAQASIEAGQSYQTWRSTSFSILSVLRNIRDQLQHRSDHQSLLHYYSGEL
jgi:hypothetical protein